MNRAKNGVAREGKHGLKIIPVPNWIRLLKYKRFSCDDNDGGTISLGVRRIYARLMTHRLPLSKTGPPPPPGHVLPPTGFVWNANPNPVLRSRRRIGLPFSPNERTLFHPTYTGVLNLTHRLFEWRPTVALVRPSTVFFVFYLTDRRVPATVRVTPIPRGQ